MATKAQRRMDYFQSIVDLHRQTISRDQAGEIIETIGGMNDKGISCTFHDNELNVYMTWYFGRRPCHEILTMEVE